MRAVFYVIDLALVLYIWVLIAAVVFSWLVAFNLVDTRNQAIAMIGEFLSALLSRCCARFATLSLSLEASTFRLSSCF